MAEYPKVSPDLSGERYCVPCVWNGVRHPDRGDDERIYVIRFSDQPLDTKSVCTPHLAAWQRDQPKPASRT